MENENEKKIPTNVRNHLLIKELKWTKEQALETRMKLLDWEDDWDYSGMELYDDI